MDIPGTLLARNGQGGVATTIIEKNTTIPTTKAQVFSTTEDSQDVVRIHVLQGEREMAADNMTMGRFELVGIPPAPRGVPQIEVTFAIDTDGVVDVSAKDLGTGKSQSVRATASSGMSEEDIERLVSDAEDHAQADRARRDLIELKNKGEALVYSTERTLEEFAENVDEADRGTFPKGPRLGQETQQQRHGKQTEASEGKQDSPRIVRLFGEREDQQARADAQGSGEPVQADAVGANAGRHLLGDHDDAKRRDRHHANPDRGLGDCVRGGHRHKSGEQAACGEQSEGGDQRLAPPAAVGGNRENDADQ